MLNSRPDPVELAAALDAAGDPIEIISLDGVICHVNAAWEELTGFTVAEARGRRPRDLLQTTIETGAAEATVEAALGRPWRGLASAVRKDGSRFEADVLVNPVRGEAGEVVALVAVRRDITQQRRQSRLLSLSEERLKLAALGAKDGLWDWSLDAPEMYVSARWLALLGEDAGAEGQVRVSWFFGQVHEADRDRLREEYNAHIGGVTEHFESEFRVRQPSGSWRWVLCRGLAFRDPAGKAVRMAGSLTDITERKSEHRMLFFAATHDTLTALPNRGLFLDRVGHAIRRCTRVPTQRFGLLFIDLRGFKLVNDSMGHAVGDGLLVAVARRLQGCVRTGDTVARLGGDEFGVLLEAVSNERDAEAAARRIEEILRRPFDVEGQPVQISGTIGIVIGNGTSSVDSLIRDADAAMYQARRNGDRGLHLVDETGRADAARRARIALDLVAAIHSRALRLVFQPIYNGQDGHMAGVEALCRWSHPDLGAISPSEFVAIAEDNGLGGLLAVATFDILLGQLRDWRTQGRLPPRFVAHLNVSPRQIGDPRLLSRIEAAANEGAIRAGEICVEVGETALSDGAGRTADVLERLALAGVLVAIDNFGTGSTSLAQLRRHHIHALNIDRSLIATVEQDEVTRAMVAAAVSMARALKILTVAEGVETRSQLGTLRGLGCDHFQGYLLGRPTSADAVPFTLVPPLLQA